MEITPNPNYLYFVIAYIVVILGMGLYYYRRIASSEDFILAGRSLGKFVLMGTMFATWCGGGTVTGGYNSLAYSFGLGPALFFGVPSLIGVLFLFLISNRIRATETLTIPEMLEMKYGPFARALGTMIIVLSYIGIISYQYTGLGFILNVTTGIPVRTGTIIGAIIMVLLAMTGGLFSVAATDAFSAMIIMVSLILGVPAVMRAAGGWGNIVANLPATHLKLTGSLTGIQMLGYLIPTLFLLLADQNMYIRIAAAKEDEAARTGIVGWFVAMIIVISTIPFISLTARSIFPNIAPGMALLASTLVMPTVIGGLLLSGAAAFLITTGDSFLLTAATNITYDFYGKYVKPDMTDDEKLRITKWLIPVIGVLAYVLVQYFPTVLAAQMYSYTVYGAGITPAVLGIILWERVNKYGGIASMIAGTFATLVWELVLHKPMKIDSAVISVPIAILALIIVTLATSGKEKVSASKTA